MTPRLGTIPEVARAFGGSVPRAVLATVRQRWLPGATRLLKHLRMIITSFADGCNCYNGVKLTGPSPVRR